MGRAALCAGEFWCQELNGDGSGEEFMDNSQGITLPGGFNGHGLVAREDRGYWWAWLFWVTFRLCDLGGVFQSK